MRYIFHNFVNTLRHYRVSTLLNVTGLAVAFAAFYIILTQASFGLGFNRSIPDADRIYVITTPSNYNAGKKSLWICRPVGETLVSECPEVESGGLYDFYKYENPDLAYWKQEDGTVRKLRLSLNSNSQGALRSLGFEAAEGDLSLLTNPGTFAVSAAYAKANGLSLGDRVSISDNWSYADPQGEKNTRELVAIFRDFPRDSYMGAVSAIADPGQISIDNVSEWSYTYLVKLHDPSQKESFEQNSRKVMKDFVYRLYGVDSGDASAEDKAEADKSLEEMAVSLISLKDLYYSKQAEGVPGGVGNRTTDITLLCVAVLIILIALVNFINFFFALVPARLRSVNTYKIFGVSRGALIANFIGESTGIMLLSLLLAALLVYGFSLSSFAGILGSSAAFSDNVPIILLTVAVALVAAVSGSLYPAFYITSFPPALVLKGSFGGSVAGLHLRSVLIGFQFTISLALIICASFLRLQHSYMMTYDMGFDKSNLITGDLPGGICWLGANNAAFEDRLRSNPDIEDITWADGRIVSTSRMGWGRDYKGRKINFQCYPVAYNFLKFMGIDIIDGRDFTSSDEISTTSSMIFNEEARREFDIDFETPGPGHRDECEVVGICKDFNFKPLQYGRAPFAFYIFGDKAHSWRSGGLHHIYIRTAPGANPGEVIKYVLGVVQEMCPTVDPETYSLQFFDKELGEVYQRENELSQLIGLFTAVAIIISLMGIFGLVLFETQHRSREIAVRRVHGARVGDILGMFNRKFALIVLGSFAVAAPLSYFIVSRYLSAYAYRVPIHWWVFALALVAVLALTAIIVTLRSLRAATANPVESLKSE